MQSSCEYIMHIPAESIIPLLQANCRIFCLFAGSVISLWSKSHSSCRNDQCKNISKQLSITGDLITHKIQRILVCLVCKYPLLTHINKTNGCDRQFDRHSSWQLHIFWRSICHMQCSYTWAKRSVRDKKQQGYWSRWPLNCIFCPGYDHPLQSKKAMVKLIKPLAE